MALLEILYPQSKGQTPHPFAFIRKNILLELTIPLYMTKASLFGNNTTQPNCLIAKEGSNHYITTEAIQNAFQDSVLQFSLGFLVRVARKNSMYINTLV